MSAFTWDFSGDDRLAGSVPPAPKKEPSACLHPSSQCSKVIEGVGLDGSLSFLRGRSVLLVIV